MLNENTKIQILTLKTKILTKNWLFFVQVKSNWHNDGKWMRVTTKNKIIEHSVNKNSWCNG